MVKTNNWCLIELLELNSNTWKHLTVCKQIELFVLDRNKWNHLTTWKKISSGSFKNAISKMCLEIIYLM